MKNLTIAFLAAASLFSVSACKKKGGDVGAAMAKMEEFKTNMCKCTDAACATKVTEDMTKWSQEFAKTASKDQKIDEATTKKMTELTMAMSECAQKAMTPAAGSAAGSAEGSAAPAAGSADGSAAAAGSADGSAAGSAAPMAAAGDLPAECAEYKAGIEKFASCDKVPQATRDAMKSSFDQMSASWANAAAMPAEAKAAMATGCKSAADALKQASAACN